MGVVAGTRATAVVGATSLSTQCSGSVGLGLLPIVSCQSQTQGLQPPLRLKSSIIQQTRSSILSWLQSKRDGSRNFLLFFLKHRNCSFFLFSLAFCLFLIPNSLDFSHFRLSYLKMFTLNETRPVYSLKPDAFEHYSRPQQINITTFPYRLFAIAKTL